MQWLGFRKVLRSPDLDRSSLVGNAEEFVVLQISFFLLDTVALQFVPVSTVAK